MTVYTGTDLCCNNDLVSKHRRWKWLLLFLLGLLAMLMFLLQLAGIGSIFAAPKILLPVAGTEIGAGQLTLTGTGQADSTVQLLCNDTVLGNTGVGSDGNWSFPTSVDNPGTCDYKANAIDGNSNVRAVSNVVSYAAPAMAIGGMAIGGMAIAADNLAKPVLSLPTGDLMPGNFNITGSAMPNTELQFLVDGEASGNTMVDATGNWSYDVELADAGEYNLTADTLYDNGDVAISSDNYSLMLNAAVAAAEPTATSVPVADTPEPTATDVPEPTATDMPEPTVAIAAVEPEPVGSAVGGYIWLDINGDGIRDEDEPLNIISMPITLTDEDGNSQTVESNSEGYFEFADVASGTYDIKFLKPDAFNYTLDNVGDSGQSSAVQVLDLDGAPNEGTATIEVVEGEEILVSAGLTLGVGINMEIVASDELVCAGDAVTIQMYTRLLNASEGFQLRNIEIYNTDLGDDADIRGTYFVPESDVNGNGHLDWLDLDGEDSIAPNGDKRSDEEFVHEYTRTFDETTTIQAGDQADIYFSNDPSDPAAGTSLGQTISAEDSITVTVVNPQLSVTVVPASGAVEVGEEAIFNVTILNAGDVEITDLQVSHNTATQCDQVIETLAPNESRKYTCSFPELTTDTTLQVQAQGTVGDNLCMVSNENTANITALAAAAALTPTPVPPTAVPPTTVPPTAVPPTAVPPTAVPPTAVPPTAVPPTAVPPPTAIPTVVVPPTVMPTATHILPPPEVLPKTGISSQGIWLPNVMIPLFGLLIIGLVGLFENRRRRDEM